MVSDRSRREKHDQPGGPTGRRVMSHEAQGFVSEEEVLVDLPG